MTRACQGTRVLCPMRPAGQEFRDDNQKFPGKVYFQLVLIIHLKSQTSQATCCSYSQNSVAFYLVLVRPQIFRVNRGPSSGPEVLTMSNETWSFIGLGNIGTFPPNA